MFSLLIKFIKHPTSINVIINTLGNYLSVFFTALFALILVRIMTPSEYGVLSVLLSIAYVLANILDFGTTATIYSYLPTLFEQKSYNLYRFIKSTFYYQSLFSVIVIAALFISFPFLDKVFFKTHAPEWQLYLTSTSVLFFIWQNTISNILFAVKKFMRANVYTNISNLIKTVVLFALIPLHLISVGSIIFVFGIIGPLAFFLLVFFEHKEFTGILIKSKVSKEEFRFRYTLTYFLASQFFNLGSRMDLFLLSFFGLKNDVGYYGLSQKIILTVITTIVSITQVLSPGFSKYKDKKDILNQLKTGFLYLLLPTILFLILFFLPDFIYQLVFTNKFTQTAPITKALSLPFIIYALGSLPVLFLLYTVKKPVYILVSNIIFFIVLTGGCIYLIPLKGVFGPPIAIFAALAISTLMLIPISVYEYKKLPEKQK